MNSLQRGRGALLLQLPVLLSLQVRDDLLSDVDVEHFVEGGVGLLLGLLN